MVRWFCMHPGNVFAISGHFDEEVALILDAHVFQPRQAQRFAQHRQQLGLRMTPSAVPRIPVPLGRN
jgi:hypothetical protein